MSLPRTLLAMLCATAPAAAPAAARQGTVDELPAHPRDIAAPPLPLYKPVPPERHELECGARLLVLEAHEVPLVDGVLRFHAGSILDPPDRAGLAALLADVLRAGGSLGKLGTDGESGTELDAWLDAHAATIEVTAGLDEIRITFSCLSEDLEEVLGRAAALVLDPAYPADVFEKARRRSLTEIERKRDDTSLLADEAMLLLAYGVDSPYARVPTRSSVVRIRREDLAQYHRAHLGGNRLIIGITGDVTGDTARALANTAFAELGEVAAPPPVEAPAFIQPTETRIYVIDRPGVSQTELRLAAPGTRRSDPDYASLFLWSHVVGAGGFTNRITIRVRTELGLAYSVGAYFGPEWNRAGRFTAYCGTRNDAVGAALEAMLGVLREGLERVPADELDAVRRRVLNADVFQIDTPAKQIERALELEFHGYPADFWDQRETRLRRATPEELEDAIARNLAPERLLVVAVGPKDEIVPALSALGEVSLFDPAAEIDPSAGQPPLVQEMLDAVGGREFWSALSAMEVDIAITGPNTELATRQWLDFREPRQRVAIQSGGATRITILDGEQLTQSGPEGLTEFPPEAVARLRRARERGIWALLHAIAAGDGVEVTLEGENQLRVTSDRGLDVTLILGEDKRPRSLQYTEEGVEKVFTYSEWTDRGGFSYAAKIEESTTGYRWRVTRLQVLDAFDPELLNLQR